MIEELINFKLSMIHKRPKKEVIKKFKEYCDEYDKLAGQRTVIEKSEYRDLKHEYMRYISSSMEEKEEK